MQRRLKLPHGESNPDPQGENLVSWPLDDKGQAPSNCEELSTVHFVLAMVILCYFDFIYYSVLALSKKTSSIPDHAHSGFWHVENLVYYSNVYYCSCWGYSLINTLKLKISKRFLFGANLKRAADVLVSSAANWLSFDFNVAYPSCWGYSLINTLKLNKVSRQW